jgi:hypothetical protein
MDIKFIGINTIERLLALIENLKLNKASNMVTNLQIIAIIVIIII